GSLLFLLAVFLFGCNEQKTHSMQGFQRMEVDFAQGLRIWKDGKNFRVEIRNPRDTSVLLKSYFFSPELKAQISDSISIPVKSAGLNSTTFVAYFDKLGVSDLITGVTFTDRIKNQNVTDQIAAGHTVELTSAGELDF